MHIIIRNSTHACSVPLPSLLIMMDSNNSFKARPPRHWLSHPLVITGIGVAVLLALPLVTAGRMNNTLEQTGRADARIQTVNLAITHEQEPAHDGIKECIVTLVSGRTLTGELISQDSQLVVVSIKGIKTTFQRRSVSSVTVLEPVPQRYKEMRDAIPDEDIDSRLTLIEWLRNRKAYTLAISELESVLLEAPNNPRAKLLHTWLIAYDELGPSSTQPESPSRSTLKERESETPGLRMTKAPKKIQIPRLTPEQINLMRVYEIDLRNPPKLTVPDETLRDLMRLHPDAFSPSEDQRKAIFKLSQVDKLKLLFTHKARELYSQVIIHEDPSSMKKFKFDVHARQGWIINACATARCHGSPNSSGLELINTRANSDETVYTNFYILEHYRLRDGSPLINYESPEHSALLQMGMIEKNTLNPHPEIPKGTPGRGYRPIFRSSRDHKYRQAIEWIRSMYQPRPEYDFDYPPQPDPEPEGATP